jgi:glutamyl-tRNA synthetase
VILSWENLYAYNRKILDQSTDRYFFVQNPIELTVRRVPKSFDVKISLHPDHPERGFRSYRVQPHGNGGSVLLWVSSKDVDASRVGTVLRLMELFNVKIEKANVYSAEGLFASESYAEARKAKAQLIHWIPVGNDFPCNVVMPDATVTEGVAEDACRKLEPDDIVQFERFGFVRVDHINTKLIVYFAQK